MALTIPESDQDALATLLRMAEPDFERLLGALGAAAASISLVDLSDRVASASGLPPDDVFDVLSIASTLYMLRDLHAMRADEISADLYNAAAESGSLKALADGRREEISGRVLRLLTCDRPLGVSAKALGVLLENERVYHDSRIVTDIRPVFLPGSAQTTHDSVIVHSLRISFHKGRRRGTRDFFVALSDDDLLNLRTQLERALTKEDALKAVAAKGEVKCLPYKLGTKN